MDSVISTFDRRQDTERPQTHAAPDGRNRGAKWHSLLGGRHKGAWSADALRNCKLEGQHTSVRICHAAARHPRICAAGRICQFLSQNTLQTEQPARKAVGCSHVLEAVCRGRGSRCTPPTRGMAVNILPLHPVRKGGRHKGAWSADALRSCKLGGQHVSVRICHAAARRTR